VALVEPTVQARAGVEFAGMQVAAQIGEGHRIDLVYHPPAGRAADEAALRNAALVATESLLGEAILDRWIGLIEVAPHQQAVPGVIALERLPETVAGLIQSINDELPAQPCYTWADDAEWSLIQLEPAEQDDYPRKTDLLLGITMLPDMWLTAQEERRAFYSARFSRCGETFCYLKIDGVDGLEGSQSATGRRSKRP
jgi:hypothetical protein